MNPPSEILNNMNLIRGIFMDSQDFCRLEQDPEQLIRYAELKNNDFRAVAYESIAMNLALQDFTSGEGDLPAWHQFKEKASVQRLSQVHVGLGWAMAKLRLPAATIIEKLDPLQAYRLVDGYAYYEGSFRTLQSIDKQVVPDWLSEKQAQPYNQGLGRSIWYLCRGNAQDAADIIHSFSPERHKSLWRGIGLACAFVGGVDEPFARNLIAVAGEEYRVQLAAGAVMAAQSRLMNHCLTPSALHCCRTWGNLFPDEVNLISSYDKLSGPDAYFDWIRQIEEGVSKQLHGVCA